MQLKEPIAMIVPVETAASCFFDLSNLVEKLLSFLAIPLF